MAEKITAKKIAMIIAQRDFQDEEYFTPKEALESAGAEVITFSESLGKALGKFGGEAKVDALLEDLGTADYDAIVFIGGPGAQNYINNSACHKIAKDAVKENKVLAAICIAPAILAESGVLEGKKATVWSSAMDKTAVKILKDKGAIYQPEDVVQDDKIITASGPSAASEFAQKIIEALK
jgi:protease I